MSNISGELIKDSYNYVLQSDLITGIVYRIGGTVPVNPWFTSGLTITGGFKFGDSPQLGYVLTSDVLGNASWQPVSAATPSSGVTSITVGNGLSANTSTGNVTIVFTGTTTGLTYYVQTTTPTGTTSGDRWFDTNTGVELVWIDDGDSSQWVQPYTVPGPINGLSKYIPTGITSSQTITWDKNYWGISASTNVDITLPTTLLKDGYYLIIKDESGNCGTYRIRLTPSVGLIDGNNYVDMNINFMSLTCMVRDGNWYLI